MKVKIFLWLTFCTLCSITACAQDKRATIYDYLNQEILIIDNFAGQSITLVKENKDYFILRRYFGSGIPVIMTAKYKVEFTGDYKIHFSEMIGASNADTIQTAEKFILTVETKGLVLYLNGLKIVINEHSLGKVE